MWEVIGIDQTKGESYQQHDTVTPMKDGRKKIRGTPETQSMVCVDCCSGDDPSKMLRKIVSCYKVGYVISQTTYFMSDCRGLSRLFIQCNGKLTLLTKYCFPLQTGIIRLLSCFSSFLTDTITFHQLIQLSLD